MKKALNLIAVVALMAFVAGCDSSDAQSGFNNGSLVGDFGYSFSGFIEVDRKPVVETGVFTSDGLGNLTGTGRTVINGQNIFTATYENCEYEVNPDGTILVDPCTRIDEDSTASLRLFMTLSEDGRQVSIIVLPTGNPVMDLFGTADLLGSAQKQ